MYHPSRPHSPTKTHTHTQLHTQSQSLLAQKQAQQARFRAHRAFHLAEFYASKANAIAAAANVKGKEAERDRLLAKALALHDLAATRAAEARELATEEGIAAVVEEMGALKAAAGGACCALCASFESTVH